MDTMTDELMKIKENYLKLELKFVSLLWWG